MPQPASPLNFLNPLALIANLWPRRDLTFQFTRREIQGRYKGSHLGLLWALINPLLMLAVYTFVFHYLYHAGGNQGIFAYAINMYAGMIAYNIFSESVTRAPTVITQNPNYVKKVVFPLEILPLSLIGSALFHALLSTVILLLAALAPPHWTLIYLPVVLLPLVLLTAGLSWFLAALGVFLRDIGHVIGVLVTLLFFLTPITYPASVLHGLPAKLMRFNLMADFVEDFRRVVVTGQPPRWDILGLTTIACLIVALAGYAWFMTFKRAFADVI
jgi:lipopolysaccharide transport system permease protein